MLLSTVGRRSIVRAHYTLCVSCSQKRLLSNLGPLHPNEYELRIGYAITALQDDLPSFFYKGLQDHGIYSPHVVLSDPHYTRLSLKGKTAYLGAAEMLRWSLDCYFEKVDLDIVKMRLLPEDTTDLDGDRMPPSSTLFVSTAARQLLSMPALRQPPTSKTTSTSMVLPPAPTPSQYQRHRRFASVADQDSTKGHLVKYGGAQAQDRPSARVRSLEIRWQMLARPRSFFSHAHEKPTKHVEGVFIYTFDDQGYISEHKIQHIVPSPSRRILLLHSYGSKVRAFLESMKRREPVLRPGLG